MAEKVCLGQVLKGLALACVRSSLRCEYVWRCTPQHVCSSLTIWNPALLISLSLKGLVLPNPWALSKSRLRFLKSPHPQDMGQGGVSRARLFAPAVLSVLTLLFCPKVLAGRQFYPWPHGDVRKRKEGLLDPFRICLLVGTGLPLIS